MLPIRGEATYAPTNGAVEAKPAFERRDALLVSPAPVTLTEETTMIQITYRYRHAYTLDKCVALANCKKMTLQQGATTKPLPHAHVLLMNTQRSVNTFYSQPVVPRTDID